MSGGGDYLQDLTGQVIGLAGDYVKSGGVRVLVKTNLGPAIPVYSGGEGGGLASALGIRAGVIVQDANGKTLAHYGSEAPTEPLKVAGLLLLAGLVTFALVRGVLPRR